MDGLDQLREPPPLLRTWSGLAMFLCGASVEKQYYGRYTTTFSLISIMYHLVVFVYSL